VRRRYWAGALPFLVTLALAAPRVDVRGTIVEGRWNRDVPAVAEFLGVPYALPPVGARRFAAPVAWLPEAGIRRADAFAAGCYQDDYNTRWYQQVGAYFGAPSATFVDPPFSEDCLYLNVWTPRPDPTARLPVLVWFHGGSNKAGWSFEPNYQGARFAARGQVLLVTVGYRLGVFGFLPDPFAAGSEGTVNLGLQDQIAALRYVRRFIAAYGGDPTRVTIAGESAGGADVLALLASPDAQGLYARAIIESGGYNLRGAPSLSDQRAVSQKLAHSVGARSSQEWRDRPSAALFLAAKNAEPAPYFLPVVDGRVLPHEPALQLKRGLSVDVLVGSNANESLLYVTESTAALDRMIAELPTEVQSDVRPWVEHDGSARHAQDTLGSFLDMGCSAETVAAAVRSPHRAYLYRFNRVRRGAAQAGLGAYHGAEIPYVFNTHDAWLPTDDTDRQLTQIMGDYWAAFVTSGNPNRPGLPTWPAYDSDRAQAQLLGDTVISQPAPDHARCLQHRARLYPGV
jgi:para-nitrobenzyl esterase